MSEPPLAPQAASATALREALEGLVARWKDFTARNGGWGNQEDAYYDLAKHAQKEWRAAIAALSVAPAPHEPAGEPATALAGPVDENDPDEIVRVWRELEAERDRLRAEVATLTRERDDARAKPQRVSLAQFEEDMANAAQRAQIFGPAPSSSLNSANMGSTFTPAPAACAEDARLAGLRHVKQIIEVDYVPDSSIRGYYTDFIEREIARLTTPAARKEAADE